jgi:PHD/YefM family antitoxin component YafN of YafNO toxin-antitoxin module
MIELTNIHSLTDFQKQTKEHLKRLKKTGKPEVLTLNGHAEVVVQSAKGYQELLDRADLADSVRILGKRSESSTRKDIPAEKVLAEIRAKLGI